ncbi:MAG: type II toxin-antitoxin system Phd/YefM family antitoxin [Candidatus Amesbacteria bacterium]|nr:type II toxin-antitoxin system Phd/YefM family antitoxin [Candidatus Amesbacteria bacterium]
MNIVPTLIPVSDLQRDSARIVNLAKLSEHPIIIVRNNKPEVAMFNVDKLQKMFDRLQVLEENALLLDLRQTEADFKAGKLKSTTDFSEFLND